MHGPAGRRAGGAGRKGGREGGRQAGRQAGAQTHARAHTHEQGRKNACTHARMTDRVCACACGGSRSSRSGTCQPRSSSSSSSPAATGNPPPPFPIGGKGHLYSFLAPYINGGSDRQPPPPFPPPPSALPYTKHFATSRFRRQPRPACPGPRLTVPARVSRPAAHCPGPRVRARGSRVRAGRSPIGGLSKLRFVIQRQVPRHPPPPAPRPAPRSPCPPFLLSACPPARLPVL